jgi:hypothetical protein
MASAGSDDSGNGDIVGDGDLRGSSRLGTALISGATFTNKAVTYYDLDGMAMLEGDIAIGVVSDIEKKMAAAQEAVKDDPEIAFSVGITGAQFRWPNCQIPFDIDPALPNQQRVTDAIAHWEANTSIRFVLRTAANQAQFPNWVHFTDASGCWSFVGMQGGQQTISLGAGCSTGNAIHEIGHAVGLWHEQSREDRDLFVTIQWANIQNGMAAQFNQHITDGDDLGGYDYGSIMHYPRNAFSRNGLDTIVPTNPAAVIGQRTGLSAGDLGGVQSLYPSCGVPWNLNNLTLAAGAPVLAASIPAGYTWDVDSTQHVVYRGTDNHIHELWFNSQWNHNDLTVAAGAPLAVGDPAGYTWDVDHTQHVVYRGTDNHIHELWFNGQWNHNDLTVAASAPLAAGFPAGYTWNIDSTQHVVYRGMDDHIHELWFNGQWNHNDLTVAAGAPLAVGDPAGYTWNIDSTQHVVYRGNDAHIHELWFNGQWNHNDLTVAASAPLAVGDPDGYTWSVDSTQHVVYRGSDAHIHELWFNGQWNHNDLTVAASAPAAVGEPAGYTWDVDNTQHVVYRGNDAHIHELWFNGQWNHNDLTLAASAPVSAGDPDGYTWSVDRTEHVVFQGNDSHIYELWFHL